MSQIIPVVGACNGAPVAGTLADPAAGANATFIITTILPSGTNWAASNSHVLELHYIKLRSVSSATAGNRLIGIELINEGATQVHWTEFWTNYQTASQDFQYVFVFGGSVANQEAGGWRHIPCPKVYLQKEIRIRTISGNFHHASDQFSELRFGGLLYADREH